MKLILLFSLFFSTLVFATSPHSQHRLIVALKKHKSFPFNDLIKRKRKLFKNIYVVYSDDIIDLKNDLKDNPNIRYVENDYKGSNGE